MATDSRPLHREIASAERSDEQSINKVMALLTKLKADRPTINAYLQQYYRSHQYPHIVCYDETRFVYPDDDNKFYHASWVDGYAIKRQYLLATAPHTKQKTEDFWAMALSVMSLAIVVLNDVQNLQEFWPSPSNEYGYSKDQIRSMTVINNERLGEAPDGSFQKYRLTLVKFCADEKTRIETILYVMRGESSPVPGYFPQLRAELSRLRKELNKNKPKKHHMKANDNILLVCGDGVTKNGNYCVFDIIMNRVIDKQLVGLKETVLIVRLQRYGTVNSLDQYRQLNGLLHAQLQDYNKIGYVSHSNGGGYQKLKECRGSNSAISK